MITELINTQSHPTAGEMRIEIHCLVFLLNCCRNFKTPFDIFIISSVLEFITFCEYYLEVLA